MNTLFLIHMAVQLWRWYYLFFRFMNTSRLGIKWQSSCHFFSLSNANSHLQIQKRSAATLSDLRLQVQQQPITALSNKHGDFPQQTTYRNSQSDLRRSVVTQKWLHRAQFRRQRYWPLGGRQDVLTYRNPPYLQASIRRGIECSVWAQPFPLLLNCLSVLFQHGKSRNPNHLRLQEDQACKLLLASSVISQ